MARVLALINQKGGVGKTTCTANLGACLAEAGRRVLVVDLDPQSNLSVHLGIDPHQLEASMREVLLDSVSLAEILRPTPQPGLTIAPATLELASTELELTAVPGREVILVEALAPVADQFDYVLIDCPPSLGLLTLNALTSAAEVFLILQTEYFALQGSSHLLNTLNLVRRRLNKGLRLSGVVACMFDRRKNICREVFSEIRGFFGDAVFNTPIRHNVALTEAPSHGLPINLYATTSNGAFDFRMLAQEVIKQEKHETTASASAAAATKQEGEVCQASA